ncbi:hypothetical protein JAAARDRAFT_35312 [Jaapia argillacea MUCL 33604]|uniref:Inhibitor I9 domain-containing protein n=1 Tax=Jaapia argillacea MUCL 33604 TaxID=933084 RepID=A0A067PSA5_9AGAM|nr:hypothetical protein JAAARDRAFT_35312 [Jaapia argillacea MUCL 33604]
MIAQSRWRFTLSGPTRSIKRVQQLSTSPLSSRPSSSQPTTPNMSGKYIVVFKESTTPEQINKYADEVSSNGGQVSQRYDSVLKGFSATIPDAFLQQLQGSDVIDYIEPDGIVTTQ